MSREVSGGVIYTGTLLGQLWARIAQSLSARGQPDSETKGPTTASSSRTRSRHHVGSMGRKRKANLTQPQEGCVFFPPDPPQSNTCSWVLLDLGPVAGFYYSGLKLCKRIPFAFFKLVNVCRSATLISGLTLYISSGWEGAREGARGCGSVVNGGRRGFCCIIKVLAFIT